MLDRIRLTLQAAALAPRLASRKDILPQTLTHCLFQALSSTDPGTAANITTTYGLDASSTAMANTQASIERVLNFGNDVCFAFAARKFADAWSLAGLDAFLYRFNCPNPWDGAWKDHATHILDLAFLLRNYDQYLSKGQQQASGRFAGDVISFVQGGEPWVAYRNGAQEGSMVYNAPVEGELDRSEYVECETPQRTGRRILMHKMEAPGVLDKLMDGWQMFMAQK